MRAASSGEQRRQEAGGRRRRRTRRERPALLPLCRGALQHLQSPRPHHVAARGGAAPPLAPGAGMLRSGVVAGLRRRTKAYPQATTRATRAPEGDTSYPVHLPAPVSSFSARLPTVTSALPDASWETGPKRRGVCGQTCVGEAFLIPACHSPLFHLCFCCLRLWHVLVTQTRKCRWFHSKGMPFVSCSGCGGSPWLSHKCISVLFNSCMY